MQSKPIKVLHVIGSLGLGGAQICVKYIIENSPPEIENYVYPLRCKPSNIHIDGEIINIPYSNYDPRKFLALVKLCRKYEIDIIHAHLPKPIIGCLLASFFCKAKVVVHEHGPVFRWASAFPGHRLLVRLLKKRAAIFIAVSQATAERLIKTCKISPKRIKVVYNAVDEKIFDSEKYESFEVRKALEVPDNVTVLGFIGRLSDQKGVDILIRSMAILNKRSHKYKLLIVGDGPRRKQLENLAGELGVEDDISFLGFCHNVPEVISAFDIGLVPSRFEPFGITAIELMQMKIPVITSGANGLSEIFDNEINGLITSKNDPVIIADSVERLNSDLELKKSITASAFETAKKYHISEYKKQVYKIYSDLMANN